LFASAEVDEEEDDDEVEDPRWMGVKVKAICLGM
jgi:hypothetical protein